MTMDARDDHDINDLGMTWQPIETTPKCKTCHNNPATPPHTCPFKTEIHGDDTLCNCCRDCRAECRWDI